MKEREMSSRQNPVRNDRFQWMRQYMTRRTVAFTAMCLGSALATGCGPFGASLAEPIQTYLPQMEKLAGKCSGPIEAYVAQDLSATGLGSSALLEARALELKRLVLQVSACGGYVQAVGFSASSADTVPFGETSFPVKGSGEEETARLIAAHKASKQFLTAVHAQMPHVARAVGPRGTDVLSQLQLAREFALQHPGHLVVQVETDGIASAGPVYMEYPQFTKAVAEVEASSVSVPQLPGATVRFVGIGHTSAPGSFQLSTTRVDALLRFYEIVCHRTDAAQCDVVTDYAEGGES
jgi:hypothetical protein